jgi:hypothetical protein
MFGVPTAGDIDYTKVVSLDLGTVAPSLAGPKRPQDRIEITNLAKRVHPAVQQAHRRQRLQPAGRQAGAELRPASGRGAQRRHPDRRHHLLHQHLQPGRAAGRRPAGQEGGGGRPHGGAAHQDLAGARLAHRHRVPAEGRPAALPRKARLQRGRLRLHDLHRQCRRPDARAQRGDHPTTTWSAPPCCRATATSRRASTPT